MDSSERLSKEDFLRIMKFLESSGGTNLEHKEVKSGLHKGDTAIGGYAFMPKTIDELIARRIAQKNYGPDENVLSNLEDEDKKNFIENQPRVEDKLADQMYNLVNRNTDSSPDPDAIAAYRWRHGQNTPAAELDEDTLARTPRVQAFRKLKEKYIK